MQQYWAGKELTEEVKAQIIAENPTYKIDFVEMGMMTTMEYRADRVRVWYDAKTNIIVETRIG